MLNISFLVEDSRIANACLNTSMAFKHEFFIKLFNQKTYIEHELKTSKLPIEVIRKCSVIGGCTEPTLQGMSYGIVQAGFINHGKIIDLTLNDGVDPMTEHACSKAANCKAMMTSGNIILISCTSPIRNWQQYWNYVMISALPILFH